jgi:tRNA A-37 threonylcarbamoyl transferase component Bud32/tetratricopeptide (TPR) repeat protein
LGPSDRVACGSGVFAPAERGPYLRRSTDDEWLVTEVLSLLAAGIPSCDVLERPALEWYRPEIDSIEPPEVTARLHPGEVLAGRFRVEGFLGRGGMGEVYAANDNELRERVALKLLHPDLAVQASFLERFRREIRLARRISHPNVARVFDLVQDRGHALGEFNFFIMELLEGETLMARLRRAGPILPTQALPIARQLAAGLGAAHSAGVIHRDLKPSNVILLPDRAVITDFGLAVPVEPGSAQAQLKTTSILMGTPGYVAPEQWAGKPASMATDIYAFGIVLHEMVTGRHPSVETDLLGPKEWAAVVRKCMELDPGKRWLTPQEAVEALEPRWWPLERFAGGGALSRRMFWSATGLATVGAVVAGTYRMLQNDGKLNLARGSAVLYAGIVNQTGDQELVGVETLMRTQLEQSAQFSVAGPTVIGSILRAMSSPTTNLVDMKAARQVAWRGGMALLIYGIVSRIGDGLVLTLSLEQTGANADRPRRTWVQSFPAASKRAMFDAAHDAALWMRRISGENASELAARDCKPEDATTPSWEALDLFTQASRLREQQKLGDAVVLLRKAVEKDPDFASAWMRLGDIQINLRHYTEGYQAWAAAMSAMQRRKISLREELHLKTQFALDARDSIMADENSRLYTLYYPDLYEAHFLRGFALANAKRAYEAIGAFEAAQKRAPGAFAPVTQAAWACFSLRDWARVDDSAKRVRKLGQPLWSDLLLGVAALVRGMFDTSVPVFEKLRECNDSYFRSRATGLLAQIRCEQGNRAAARSLLEQGVVADRESGNAASGVNKLLALAHLAWKQGNHTDAVTAIEEGMEMESGPTRLMRAAGLLARLRKPDVIAALQRRLPENSGLHVHEIARHRLEGERLYATGRAAQALSELTQAAALDLPAYPKEYLPRVLTTLGRKQEANQIWLEMRDGLGYLASIAEEQDPDTFSNMRALGWK